MRVADYIAHRCVAAGARHVFLVTGGGAMHLNDAFGRHPDLEIVCFHHEQAAAMAADAYYRIQNRFCVLNVTTGPGGINALNGVHGAYVDSLAMLVISGQVKRETLLTTAAAPLRQLGDQEVDIVRMAMPVVKYAHRLDEPSDVRKVMDKALYLALEGRAGPVWIDVPIDVQSARIDPEQLSAWTPEALADLASDPSLTENTRYGLEMRPREPLSDQELDALLAELSTAKRPVLMAGTGVRLAGQVDTFRALSRQLNIPVVTGWNAHDVLGNESHFYAGRPGTVGDRAGNFAVQNADFLIILGCRLNIRQISYHWRAFAAGAFKVMVDADPAELEKPTLSIDRKICADLKAFLPRLLTRSAHYSPPPEHQKYLDWCKARVMRYPVVASSYRDPTKPLNPYYFMELLFERAAANEIIVTGNGSACVMGFQAALLKEGQRLFTNSGAASMGYDLPAAIGASLAADKQRILCLAGDGSVMMNLQEIQTLIGYRLPVKLIVIQNQGYHSIRQTQEAYFSDNVFGTGPVDGVTLPDFVAIAKAFGLDAVRVASKDDWMSADVSRLLRSEAPALIEVVVDPGQAFSPKLASRKREDGTMESPPLDDMAPFLDREELAKNRWV